MQIRRSEIRNAYHWFSKRSCYQLCRTQSCHPSRNYNTLCYWALDSMLQVTFYVSTNQSVLFQSEEVTSQENFFIRSTTVSLAYTFRYVSRRTLSSFVAKKNVASLEWRWAGHWRDKPRSTNFFFSYLFLSFQLYLFLPTNHSQTFYFRNTSYLTVPFTLTFSSFSIDSIKLYNVFSGYVSENQVCWDWVLLNLLPICHLYKRL